MPHVAAVAAQLKLNLPVSEKDAIAAIYLGEESLDFAEKGASEILGAVRLRKV